LHTGLANLARRASSERSRRWRSKPGYDHADEFKVGLDVILDAIERLRATGFSRVEER